MRILSPLSVLVLVLLAITNPTVSDYAVWVRQEVAGSQVNNPLGLIASLMAEPLVQASSQRKNFILFSVFTTQLDASHQATTLGFAKNFIALPPPQTPWRPGAPSPASPHVVAATEPGKWKPEDGYAWVVPPNPGDVRVKWQPGKLSENLPHLVAAVAEGRWLPEDGYVWNIDGPPVGQLGVHWVVGRPSTKFSHVVAAPAQGRWLPENGYRWLTNPPPPGDLRVVPVTSSMARNEPALSPNQRKAGCSVSMEELLCPGPGTGLCWAEGHNPYRNEPPMAIDVGNEGSSDYGHTERCSGDAQEKERLDAKKANPDQVSVPERRAREFGPNNETIGLTVLNPKKAFLFNGGATW